ncbi:MAG: type III pantothenate kinase [Solirubrobacteraceae bacterium]
MPDRHSREPDNPLVLLVVDVGNTQTHFGTVVDGKLLERWRFATVRGSTSDELGAALRNLLALRGIDLSQIDASIVSSTVPELGPEWSQVARRYLGHEMIAVGPGVKTGIAIRTDNPREVGADRLVNAVAAYARYGGACIVVDFGTAITYDVVSAEGEYLGGIISPGIEISLEALTQRAAKLPEIELGEPRSLIGKSTADAVRSGIVYGFAAQVDGIVGRLRAELGVDAPAIATGGLAHHIVPSFTESIGEVDELLTLTGLQLVWERNR